MEDVIAALDSKELKKLVMEGSSGMAEGLLVRGRFKRGQGDKGRSREKSSGWLTYWDYNQDSHLK